MSFNPKTEEVGSQIITYGDGPFSSVIENLLLAFLLAFLLHMGLETFMKKRSTLKEYSQGIDDTRVIFLLFFILQLWKSPVLSKGI